MKKGKTREICIWLIFLTRIDIQNWELLDIITCHFHSSLSRCLRGNKFSYKSTTLNRKDDINSESFEKIKNLFFANANFCCSLKAWIVAAGVHCVAFHLVLRSYDARAEEGEGIGTSVWNFQDKQRMSIDISLGDVCYVVCYSSLYNRTGVARDLRG